MKRFIRAIIRILIVLVLILVMVIVGGAAGVMYTRWAKDRNEIINESGDITLVEGIEIEENVTCLFMGVNGALTDFIMLGQYNPNTRQVNLMSIPRDTKVEGTIDGKINSAYAGVDPMRTVRKVEEITGVDIDYYILFKTKLLRDLVDAVGGVTVDVPINMNYDDPVQGLYIHLKKGTQTLTGKQAEQFCRFRKNNDHTGYPDGDVGRVAAQQQFIKAMISRCLEPQNLLKIGSLLNIVLENTKTNITMDIASQYIDDAVAFKADRVRTETLPGAGGYAANGLSYFFMDEEKAKELIAEMFLKETTEEDILQQMSGDQSGDTWQGIGSDTDQNHTGTVRIEVLNNGTDNKTFIAVVETLNAMGYPVVRVGNETEEGDGLSHIITYSTSQENLERMDTLSKIVGISNLETATEDNPEVDYTIILGPHYEL